MKTLAAFVAFFLLCTDQLLAQWTVYDPAVHQQTILNGTQEIAKFVEVINNQISQINALTEQLNEFKHYKELFGDPAKISVGLTKASVELTASELGQNLDHLVKITDAATALAYDGGGLYQAIGGTFKTPRGKMVTRSVKDFTPFAAINTTTRNYVTVSANAAANRVALKTEIAATLNALSSARSDAEVQKLSAGLIGLSATLNSVDHEVNQALASALIQDIENRNDEHKQTQAQREQQQAELRETTATYNSKFKLLDDPVHFPTRR